MIKLSVKHENWSLKNSFNISRGHKSCVSVVVVELEDGKFTGRGESVPYARYQQTIEQTLDEIQAIAPDLHNGLTRNELQTRLKPGAARNAVDCAIWDLEAKRTGQRVWELAKLPEPLPVAGAYTLSLDTPQNMAAAAKEFQEHSFFKLKLGPAGIIQTVEAVREALPNARLTVDANESWDASILHACLPALAEMNIEFVEQPLPVGEDKELEQFNGIVPFCADESFHNIFDLKSLINTYEIFNIKLDKTGGLTAAIELAEEIKKSCKEFMIGSLMSTSLSLAPAMMLARSAMYVDIDSSLWLKQDRTASIKYENNLFYPPAPELWG